MVRRRRKCRKVRNRYRPFAFYCARHWASVLCFQTPCKNLSVVAVQQTSGDFAEGLEGSRPMKYLLYLSGGNPGRTIGLKNGVRDMINSRRAVGGEGAGGSYYAREGGTYETKPSGDCNACPEKLRIDIPKSIETESFPSSVGTT